MRRVWHRGELRDGDIALSAFDRGLALGDGLFETLLVLNGVALDLEDHLRRLQASASLLGIAFPAAEIATSVAAICEGTRSHHVLRLTLTRGQQGRGLATDTEDFTYLATLQPFNVEMMFRPQGFTLSSICRNDTSPASQLKTTSYMDQILAAREVEAESSDIALMTNTKGKLACATIGNIFLAFGNTLVTPSLDQGILSGIMRKHVLVQAASAGMEVEERAVEAYEIERADGLFMTNALRFLCPSVRHTRHDFVPLIDLLCSVAQSQCGLDPRTPIKE
jgi:branched-chain amino acid aminotransferase